MYGKDLLIRANQDCCDLDSKPSDFVIRLPVEPRSKTYLREPSVFLRESESLAAFAVPPGAIALDVSTSSTLRFFGAMTWSEGRSFAHVD